MALSDQPGELGMVLVDDGGRNMIDFGLGPRRHGVDRVAEGIDSQRQEDRVGADAVQLLKPSARMWSSIRSTFQDSCSEE